MQIKPQGFNEILYYIYWFFMLLIIASFIDRWPFVGGVGGRKVKGICELLELTFRGFSKHSKFGGLEPILSEYLLSTQKSLSERYLIIFCCSDEKAFLELWDQSDLKALKK
jgi:hypothetical protein